jgi:hypothetical protein
MTPWRTVITIALLFAAVAVRAAEPPPRWTLGSNNWQEGKGLLPEPVLERVKKGDYTFTVVPVDPEKFRANYSRVFWQASEANAGRYDIAPNVCGLVDKATGKLPSFFFGMPFPKVDPQDPQAGCKIAWNFTAANMQGEGGGATFTINGLDRDGEFKHLRVSVEGMAFVGRHGGPIDNPENLRSTGIAFLHEPQDIEGVSLLQKRTHDWDGNDRIWGYVPSTRRVRKLNAATRSDPIGGMDVFADDGNCYAGKTEYFNWKLVGEGRILAPVIGPYALPLEPVSDTRFKVDIPYMRGAYETPGAKGVPWLVVDGLVHVPRDVWIVEGESNDPQYNFAKVVFYFDKEMFQIHWKMVYNRAGEYFYNAACGHHWAKSADDTFSAVANNLVIGVNDKTNRAAFGGRYTSQFIERAFRAGRFSLHTLTSQSD